MSTSSVSGNEESCCTCKWSQIDADDRKDLIVFLVGFFSFAGYIILNLLVKRKNNSLFKSWSFFLGFTTLVCFCYLISKCRQRQSRKDYLRSLEVYREGLLTGPNRRNSDSLENECTEMKCNITNQSDTTHSNPITSQSQPSSSSCSSAAAVTSDIRTKLPGLHVTHSRCNRGSSISSASSSSSSPSSQLINGNKNYRAKSSNITTSSSSSSPSTFLKGIHRQKSTLLFDESNFEHSNHHHHVINLVTNG